MIHRIKNHLPNRYEICGRYAYIYCTDRHGNEAAKVKIDADDLKASLFSRRWRAKGKNHDYIYGSKYRKEDHKRGESLARMLTGASERQRVRHRNGNKCDCTRENLLVEAIVGRARN